MEDAGRWIVFVTVPETGAAPAGQQAVDALADLLEETDRRLRPPA
jgi:hypothetical protein